MPVKDYTLKNKKNYVLDEAQNEIVEALLANDYFFNCAQTGLGKTFSTITAAIYNIVNRKEEDLHYVLLLPNSAVKAFTDTLTSIIGIPYSIYTATKTRVKEKARFHIFNYTTVGRDIFKKNFKPLNNQYFKALYDLRKKHDNMFLIADEAHALQDTKSVQYKTVNIIRTWFKGMWFLTATPILNNIDGLFNMTELLIPGFFKNIYAFRNKFCIFEKTHFFKTVRVNGAYVKRRIEKNVVVGYKNLDQLKALFEKISIVRALEYDVEFLYREAELSDFSKQYYKKAAAGLFSGKTLRTTADGKKVTKKTKQEHAGARLHDLQRVVSNSHPDFLYLKPNKLTEKELLLINTIKEVLERDEATLVYFSYLETLERVKYILNYIKKKFNIGTIHEVSGNIKAEKRKKVEASIKPRDVILITSAGTESINLQKANNLIFYETPFPLREFIQACGRITRTNSTFDKFFVYILEAKGTIDTYKKNRIIMNSVAIKTVVGGSNTLPVETLAIAMADREEMKAELLWWN